MKIIGDPNAHIIDYEKGNEMFCLDDKGEFITSDGTLLKWIRESKPHLRIEYTNEETIDTEATKEKRSNKCSKCDYEAENKGSLMAHYRKEHPKEGE